MPQMSGLQMLETLTQPPRVILTTAHSEFALESYTYNVVDYLLKPIEFPRFLKAIDKVLVTPYWDENQPGSVSSSASTSFMVKVDGDWVRIAYDQLLYGQSWGNYVKLFMAGQLYVTQITMSELERKLPPEQFIRIHKSFIVSLNRIQAITANYIRIGVEELPIGRIYKAKLDEVLQRN